MIINSYNNIIYNNIVIFLKLILAIFVTYKLRHKILENFIILF